MLLTIDWVTSIHVAAVRSTPKEFVDMVSAMVNRTYTSIWDFQEITNRAIVERLQHDSDFLSQLKARLGKDPTGSELATFPRYLSAAGNFDSEIKEQCLAGLNLELQKNFAGSRVRRNS